MPDLNSVPPSPRNPVPTGSRQQMPPPPLPLSSSANALPLHQRTANRPPSQTQLTDESRHVDPSSPRGVNSIAQASPSNDHNGAGFFLTRETTGRLGVNPFFVRDTAPGSGPGPRRLPRPMSAADLHLQLEKEQEAMVNFLSRELHALRDAHNSSVVSNASSTSSGTRRTQGHYRTSSNTSSVSFSARPGSVSVVNPLGAGISSPVPLRSQPPVFTPGGVSLSRQNSSSSQVAGRPPTPSLFCPDEYRIRDTTQGSFIHWRDSGVNASIRIPSHTANAPPPINSPVGPYSLSRSRSQSDAISQPISGPTGHPSALVSPFVVPSTPATTTTAPSTSEPSPALLPATSRYEETAFYRRELDTVKRENEALKMQIRELERMVRDRRASDASRAGSVAVGVPEDEVRVGESAASAGVRQ